VLREDWLRGVPGHQEVQATAARRSYFTPRQWSPTASLESMSLDLRSIGYVRDEGGLMGQVHQQLGRCASALRTYLREVELFHNSAITSVVSRDARACHQVRRKTPSSATGSAPATIFTAPRTRSKSATAQGINGFSLEGPGRRRRHDPASSRPTCQPFQGGGTSSNPVWGVKMGINRARCHAWCIVRLLAIVNTNIVVA
jgi:hypothetical protein